MRRCVSCWEKYGYLQTYGPRIYEPSPHRARALPGCAPRSRGAGDVLLGAVVEGARCSAGAVRVHRALEAKPPLLASYDEAGCSTAPLAADLMLSEFGLGPAEGTRSITMHEA
jgi:hypothetical protein